MLSLIEIEPREILRAHFINANILLENERLFHQRGFSFDFQFHDKLYLPGDCIARKLLSFIFLYFSVYYVSNTNNQTVNIYQLVIGAW